MKEQVRDIDGRLVEVEDPVVVVASSRSRATEVYRTDKGLVLVEHLKSGRDEATPISGIPDYLTVRYSPPYPWAEAIREFVQS